VAPPDVSRRSPRFALAAYCLLGVAVLAALRAWQGRAFFNHDDAVYAYTARLLIEQGGLYSEVAAAQPPLLFWTGGAILGTADSIEGLRAGVALFAFLKGALVAVAVWRLTRREFPAVAAGIASLLTPISLFDHAALIPESFVAPLLMGAALLATERRWRWASGALGAAAGAFKLPYGLIALVVGLSGGGRRRWLAGFGFAGAGLVGVSLAIYGTGVVDHVVVAQMEMGRQQPRFILGLLLQAAWNVLPLTFLAALAWRRRQSLHDAELVRRLTALAVAGLVGIVSVSKTGTGHNQLAVAEAPLVALAVAGLASMASEPRSRRRLELSLAVAAFALLLVQTASLLASPKTADAYNAPTNELVLPEPFDEFAWSMDDEDVDRAVAVAGRCPPNVAYSGSPHIAFLARRRLPGDQPDSFILAAPVHDRLRHAMEAERRRCP
jgi:hypothetical protein